MTMEDSFDDAIKLLGLSKNEVTVLGLLGEHNNPVSISRNCNIPRPTIYVTLEKLEERGLIKKRKHSNKQYWEKAGEQDIEDKVLVAHRYLSNTENSLKKKISLNKRTHIVIHRGEKEILDVFSKLIKKHAGERMFSISGNTTGKAWSVLFDPENINKINRQIKAYKMITEFATSKRWFKEQIDLFGLGWAKNFEGRSAVFHEIDDKYLNYGSQLFIFNDQVYLVSMEDGVFIEIKNPEIAKLMLSITRFVQDSSETMDANGFLRKIIEENKNTPVE